MYDLFGDQKHQNIWNSQNVYNRLYWLLIPIKTRYSSNDYSMQTTNIWLIRLWRVVQLNVLVSPSDKKYQFCDQMMKWHWKFCTYSNLQYCLSREQISILPAP